MYETPVSQYFLWNVFVDKEDLHLYFKYFNHEATDGKQPTDSEEDEDK